jgi:hypothetical protein
VRASPPCTLREAFPGRAGNLPSQIGVLPSSLWETPSGILYPESPDQQLKHHPWLLAHCRRGIARVKETRVITGMTAAEHTGEIGV